MADYDDWKLASPREDESPFEHDDLWHDSPEECYQGGLCSECSRVNCPYYSGDECDEPT